MFLIFKESFVFEQQVLFRADFLSQIFYISVHYPGLV